MKKVKIFQFPAFCFALLLLMVADADDVRGTIYGESSETSFITNMEILKYNFDVGTSPRYAGFGAYVAYNSSDGEFMAVWSQKGPLNDDCDPGDEDECTGSFESIDAQRVSPDGVLLGDALLWSAPEEVSKGYGVFAYNPFTSEYMFSYISSGLIYIARLDSSGTIQYGPVSLSQTTSRAGHSMILFNPVGREFLLVYNDTNVFSDYMNNIGFILNENGDVIEGPFPVGDQVGDFYAPVAAYNSADDTYFVVWEDFRHVSDWMYDPCDVYGAILDSDGNMVDEIALVDDYSSPDGSDQRVPIACYNPDRDEFLLSWRDDKATLDNYGILGQIIDTDGNAKGAEFVMLDGPGMQGTIDVMYIEEEKKYFATWTDTRDAIDPGQYYFLSDRADIYASWLDETGRPIGGEIELCTESNVQMHPDMAYDSERKRFFIAWGDWNAPNDYGGAEEAEGIGADIPGDIRATIYGMPSSETTTTTIPQDGTGRCPAVAIYGTSAGETKILRNFRDTVLKDIPGGRKVIDMYYSLGPGIVKIIEKNKTVKVILKNVADGMLPFVKAVSP